jgi:hypothetical protein
LSLILALLLKLQSTDKETKIIKATRAAAAMKACTDGIGTYHTIKDLGIMLCGSLRGHKNAHENHANKTTDPTNKTMGCMASLFSVCTALEMIILSVCVIARLKFVTIPS